MPDAAPACEPVAEVCDGIDNDCDDLVDEALTEACYEGPPGTSGVGPCAAGESVCLAGVWQPCMGQTLPGEEICDGVDNDCDGATDDGDLPAGACLCAGGAQQPCYSGPAGTEAVGVCIGGLQICDADGRGWGACEGQTLPSDDICDGVDNDCDGQTDEPEGIVGAGLPCGAGVGACAAQGVTECDPAEGAPVCNAIAGAPAAETCDGLDNDCDDAVDNGFGLGAACTIGVGECAAVGVNVCDPSTLGAACNAVAGAPSVESCDGLDNDCDGAVDNGFDLGAACTIGVGACAAVGVNVCDPSTLGAACNAVAGAPSVETCDGLDNDCDGAVDNGFDLGAACSVGVGACAAQGVTVCDPATGAPVCNAVARTPSAETCDGLDNDCDGQTDEPDSDLCGAGRVCLRGGCAAGPPGYVRIEPGVFTMGSAAGELGRSADETQHQVTITRAFALKATEVTQGEWQAVMGNNPSNFAACGGNCPVERVSWNDAVDYVNRLSDAAGLARCYADDANRSFAGLGCAGYRLPTEAEWEYAARAGTQTAYHTGEITDVRCNDPNLNLAGWYCGNAGNTTHPVGLKQVNAWGLYDMHGNVWEWVQDGYAAYPAGAAVDPLGPAAGDNRVVRGGSWYDGAQDARAAARDGISPGGRVNVIGFRPARSL